MPIVEAPPLARVPPRPCPATPLVVALGAGTGLPGAAGPGVGHLSACTCMGADMGSRTPHGSRDRLRRRRKLRSTAAGLRDDPEVRHDAYKLACALLGLAERGR